MAFRPDLYYRSVTDIDLAELRRRGVAALLVDLDNTLVLRNTTEAAPDVRDWIRTVLDEGFGFVIVSNNWHERVQDAAKSLGVPIVGKATKPMTGGFRRALRLLGLRADQAATVGDQIFTDILGGSLVGATTVLVVPLAGGSDLPHTRLLRALERRILAGREPARRSHASGASVEGS